MKDRPFRVLLLICLAMWSSINIWAQTQIKGFIIDAETGEGIPYANILAKPSNEGCTTDINGFFSFKSSSNATKLSISYLGYETHEYTIANRWATDISIEMSAGIKLQETVIKAKKERKIPKDTAAISLQKKVIDNKEQNRPKSYDSYEYTEQVKTEISLYKIKDNFTERKILQPFKVIFDYIDTTESGYAYLPTLYHEQLKEVYYQKSPKQKKEILLADDMTGIENLSATQLVSTNFEEFDLYNNIIEAGGKPFTSPFSKTGLITYRYYLLDSMVENGKNYYRLDFSPKNKHDIAFTGYAWIEDSSFAIKSIEFKLPSKTNINFISDFYVSQEFEKMNGENWFLDKEEVHISLNLKKSNKKEKGSILIKKKTVRDSIIVNQPIPAEVFNGEKYIIDDNAQKQTVAWWDKNRVEPLSESEAGVFEMLDSLQNTKAYKIMDWFGYSAVNAHFRAGPVELGRFYKFVSWNDIEGVRLRFGGRTNRFLTKKFQIESYFAYGLKDETWKYGTTIRLKLPQTNRKWSAMEFSYIRDFTFLGRAYDEQLLTHDNVVNSILSTGPLNNIMFNERYSVLYEKEWSKGFFTYSRFSRTTFFPVEDKIEFNEVLPNNQLAEIPNFTATELSTIFHIGIKQNYFESAYYKAPLGSTKPVLDLGYHLGVEDFIGGDYTYHRFTLDFKHRVSSKIGYTKYQISAGKILGDVPYPMMFLPVTNESFYYNVKSYNLMNNFEYGADQYASFWINHHFDGKILNKIPGINYLQLRSIFSFKALIGNATQSNQNLVQFPSTMTTPNKGYMEVGFGIENIAKMGRLDFTWRLTQREKEDVNHFGIKFAITPKL